jgi:hypothetical protein
MQVTFLIGDSAQSVSVILSQEVIREERKRVRDILTKRDSKCVCVCVCVREREREREKWKDGGGVT